MKFIVKKLLTFTITLFLISVIAFLMFQVIPGDSILSKLGMGATPERIEELRNEYGLNKDVITRYFDWLVGFVTEDGGKSYTYNISVKSLISDNIKVTIMLAVYSMVIILLVAIPLGMVMGGLSYNKKKKARYITGRFFDIINQAVMAVPSFFLGILISIIFGLTLGFFMPGRYVSYDEDFMGFVYAITPAAVSIAIPKIAMLSKYVKSSVVKTMKQDYIRTAKSKGMGTVRLMFSHVFRNAMMPVVTVSGVIATEIFAGSIVVEQVFNIPGMGKILINSLNTRDYPVVLAAVMYISVVVLLINLVVDLLYKALDPRLEVPNYE